MRAKRTPRLVASPAAQDLRGPVLGAWRYSAQRAAVGPGVGESADDLLLVAAEHRGRDGGGGDADEQHMIEPDAVETVLQRQDALDLVRLDHRLQARRRSVNDLLLGARQVIGERKNAAEIIRWMAPFGGEPGVVEIEPADHRADVERRMHRIELPRGARARARR